MRRAGSWSSWCTTPTCPILWEREGEDKDYFFRFSPEAYAVGIDILLYAMTH